MRKQPTLVCALILVTLPAFGKTPIGDWQVVRDDIPRGWQITVVTSLSFPCIFERASADELICDPLHRKQEADEIHIRRERIREIRVERREGANMLAGTGGGGGLGAILGALLVGSARGPSAYLFSLGGGSLGARSGRDVHVLHGKVIYRRTTDEPSAAGSKPARADSNAQTLR